MRSKFDRQVLWLVLVGLATLAAGTVIAIALSSIGESIVFYGKPTNTTTIAPIDTLHVIPPFIDPLGFYTISGVFIGMFFTISFFALVTALRKRRASRNEAH